MKIQKNEKEQEQQEQKEDALVITHLSKGDILPTVSTRDKRRDLANIWTSGNRIFNVNNAGKFLQLIDDYQSEKLRNKELDRSMFCIFIIKNAIYIRFIGYCHIYIQLPWNYIIIIIKSKYL